LTTFLTVVTTGALCLFVVPVPYKYSDLLTYFATVYAHGDAFCLKFKDDYLKVHRGPLKNKTPNCNDVFVANFLLSAKVKKF